MRPTTSAILRPQPPLHIGEARGVDQHRGMRRLLAPRIADRPGDDEGAHGLDQAFGQHIDRMVDLVLHRQDILVVVDQPDVPVAGIEKHLLRAEIVRWRIQPDDEMPREQVLLQRLVIGVGVDEDVGEGRRRVADIAAAMEQREQLADLAVDAGHLVARVGRIDRGIVGLVVDQQHRLADHLRALVDRMLLQPFQQVLQRAGVLLDHQDDGHVVLPDLAGVRRGRRLVEIAQGVGQRDREFALIELCRPR